MGEVGTANSPPKPPSLVRGEPKAGGETARGAHLVARRVLSATRQSLKTRSALPRKNFGHTSSLNGTCGISLKMRSSDSPMGK